MRVNRRLPGWPALPAGAGTVAVLVWPAGTGQTAQWLVTVGDARPEKVEVSDRVVPLRAVLERTRPIPDSVQVRLAAAAVLGLGALLGALLGLGTGAE